MPDSGGSDDLSETNVSLPLEGEIGLSPFPFLPFVLFGFSAVIDTFNVSSGEFESSVRTFVDYKEDSIRLVSCNSQHQLLVCSCEEIDERRWDKLVITVSLRNKGSVVWKRNTTWIDVYGSACSDPRMIFSPHSEFVVIWNILDAGHGLHILDAKTGETLHIFFKNQEDIVDCKFVDTEALVCCRKDNFLRLLNVKTGHLLSLLDIGEEPFSLGVCLHNPLVAIGLKDTKVKFITVRLLVDTQNKKG